VGNNAQQAEAFQIYEYLWGKNKSEISTGLGDTLKVPKQSSMVWSAKEILQ